MKYFTFLGLGDREKGYSEAIYLFEDSQDDVSVSKFVQQPIIERFSNEIEEINVFVTDESYGRYHSEFSELFSKFKIDFIRISSMNIEFDDFVKEMFVRIQPGDRIILDITHSFRNIPMKLLFALKYIELSSSVMIEHLYYGKFNGKTSEGVLVDFINDYRMQRVSDLLAQFNRTLILSSNDIEPLIQEDKKMNNFLNALSQFNQMTEFCEFDRCLTTVDKIIENCSSIEKEKDKYYLILPMILSIEKKFMNYKSKTNNRDKKVELIKILLEHERYQIVVTFADQFFREELIRMTLEPENKKFDLNVYLSKNKIRKKNDNLVYRLSQELILSRYCLRYEKADNSTDYDIKEILDGKEEIFRKNQKVLNKYKEEINGFYCNIRNHMNHGSTIDKKRQDIIQTIKIILECISEL